MPRSTNPSHLEGWFPAFQAGAKDFNEGRYFEAHEAWEWNWRKLPEPDRAQVQAAILVCGTFVLIGKERFAPAERLALRALERFAEGETQSKLLGFQPRLAIPGVEERLLRLIAVLRVAPANAMTFLNSEPALKALLSQKEES